MDDWIDEGLRRVAKHRQEGELEARLRLRRVVSIVLVLVSVGLIGLYNVASKPRFETFHSVDVVQLIATGMCFGAALGMLVMFLRGRISN